MKLASIAIILLLGACVQVILAGELGAPLTADEWTSRKRKSANVPVPGIKMQIAKFKTPTTKIFLSETKDYSIVETSLSLEYEESQTIEGVDLSNFTAARPNEATETEFFSLSELRRVAPTMDQGYRPAHLAHAFTPERRETKLSAQQGATKRTIFNPDGRFSFYDTAFPYSTVGKVRSAAGWCTGTVVGRRLVLTASHCVPWLEDGRIGAIKFTPHYYNGKAPFGVYHAEKVIYWQPFTAHQIASSQIAFDYVVLVMDAPVGDTTGYMGFAVYDKAWNGRASWAHIGYPYDKQSGEVPYWIGWESILSTVSYKFNDTVGQTLYHQIDIVAGHSGGPYYSYWNDEDFPRIGGVCSAENPATNLAGGGQGLADMITFARQHFS